MSTIFPDKSGKPTLLLPQALRPGDKVGLAAPASCFDLGLYERGLSVLTRMGFSVRVPEGVFRRSGYLAGSDEERAQVFMDLWDDPEIRAVFCIRGGYGSMRLLPLLDPARIRKNPKIFMGFSDLTAFLVFLVQKCGVAAFHGPVLTALAGCADPAAEISGVLSALSPEKALVLRPERPVVLHPGSAEGAVLGGNLTILTHLLGTPYAPDLAGAILFIEDIKEAPYRVDRMLTHMRLAGALEGLAGVAVGTFDGCGAEEGVLAEIKKAFDGMNVPVLAGFPSGHGPRNTAFPVGIHAVLDAGEGTLSFSRPATRSAGPESAQ